MTAGRESRLGACSLDVHAILRRSVASFYSHLVTRQTGRAVRLAIETQLAELSRPVLSLVDLSSVSILDYSCADEVVAKLLLASEGGEDVFFLLAGVRAHHLEPIEAVLERHRLAVVAETAPSRFVLLGEGTDGERRLWEWVEAQRRISVAELPELLSREGMGEGLQRLLRRRLVFRDPVAGDILALSTLAPAGGEPQERPRG